MIDPIFYELLKLLDIEPNKKYKFDKDTILLFKLSHNVDLKSINGKNPFDDCGFPLTTLFVRYINNIEEHYKKDYRKEIEVFLTNLGEKHNKQDVAGRTNLGFQIQTSNKKRGVGGFGPGGLSIMP